MTPRMRTTVRVLPLVLLLLTGCAAVGDGSGPSEPAAADGSYLIALLLPESKTARYESHDRPAFEDRVRELCPACRTTAGNAEQDPARQQAQAEAAITNGADVLVLDPVDSVSAAVIARHAHAAGVPVITYDRLVLNAPAEYHVTFDNRQVGTIQARSLVAAMEADGREGSVVFLGGATTDDNAGQYRSGAFAVLDAEDVDIGFDVDIRDWSPDKAQEAMEQAMAALGRDRIAGVYAANDGLASGAIAAMKSAGLDPLPPVTGQDAELAAIRRILVGEQHMTVYKAVREQAQVAAEIAVQKVRTGDVPDDRHTHQIDNGLRSIPTILLEPVEVTRDTIADTVLADGFWTRDEVCDGLEAVCAQAGL
jgi:D-xylose transport system substrate-binding protein